ncbi:MAG: metalloregulator ArsR/SmtB family transcription factor [Dongiaceae bacterium]
MDVLRLSDRQIADLTEMFRLMGEPSRLRIVLACLGGPRPVGEIARATGLSQTLASHHLRLLRTGHILRAERHGREIHYSLADAHVATTIAAMLAHAGEPRRRAPRAA